MRRTLWIPLITLSVTLGCSGAGPSPLDPSAPVADPEPDRAGELFLGCIGPRSVAISPVGALGGPNTQVAFGVTGSGIGGYAWDFAGGCFPNTSSAMAPQVRLGLPGTYKGKLTLTDLCGTPGYIYSFTYTITPATMIAHTPSGVSTGGRDVSMTLINGNPALAYYDSIGHTLRFARATVPTPVAASQWITMQVDGANNGLAPCLLVDSLNYPRISYQEVTAGQLRVASAKNTAPAAAADWNIQVVDSGPGAGAHSAMATSNGQIAISYQDQLTGHLRIARSIVNIPPLITSWSVIAFPTRPVSEGRYSSIGYMTPTVGGTVMCVAYSDDTNQDVRFARAKAANPLLFDDWTIGEIESKGQVGSDVQLTVSPAGKPYVTYRDAAASSLRMAIPIKATPLTTTDWTIAALPMPGVLRGGRSTMIDGTLAIDWMSTSGYLQLSRATVHPPTATDWTTTGVSPVSMMQTQVGLTAMQAPGGEKAAVSYIELGSGLLRVGMPQ